MLDLDRLLIILREFVPQPHIQDKFTWWIDANDFSVKSTIIKLNSLLILDFPLDVESKLVLNCVWKSNISSNIQVFAWRLILKRLQTRDELAKREVISGVHNLVCPLCFGLE